MDSTRFSFQCPDTGHPVSIDVEWTSSNRITVFEAEALDADEGYEECYDETVAWCQWLNRQHPETYDDAKDALQEAGVDRFDIGL